MIELSELLTIPGGKRSAWLKDNAARKPADTAARAIAAVRDLRRWRPPSRRW